MLRQREGIPQGGVLSPVMLSLHYDAMESACTPPLSPGVLSGR